MSHKQFLHCLPARLPRPGRFLEPPKELPSTKDDDNDDVEDVGDGDKDTGSHDMFAGAADSGGHAPGGAKDGVVVGGFTGSTGRLSVRSAGVGAVGANEPELIVVSSAADAATTCEGNGGRGGGRGVRGGSESDSDGEDDEVCALQQYVCTQRLTTSIYLRGMFTSINKSLFFSSSRWCEVVLRRLEARETRGKGIQDPNTGVVVVPGANSSCIDLPRFFVILTVAFGLSGNRETCDRF